MLSFSPSHSVQIFLYFTTLKIAEERSIGKYVDNTTHVGPVLAAVVMY